MDLMNERELNGLGIFKGKLKKELMQQISDMSTLLNKYESALQVKRVAVEKAKSNADAAKKRRKIIRQFAMNKKREKLRRN